MVTSKHLEAGQSYAAIRTRSGAIFGGNRAKSCAAVSKGTENEWREATGTHATRLQLLMANPCRLDHMVQSRLASCKGFRYIQAMYRCPSCSLADSSCSRSCSYKSPSYDPLVPPPFAIDNTSSSHWFRLLRFEEMRNLVPLGFKDGAFLTATNLGDLQRLFHRSVDDRHAMGALSPKSIYRLG